MRIFPCLDSFDHPVTGGEIFFAEVLNYLRTREDTELILPSETDLRFLNRPQDCLGINRYFLSRFRRLPPHTIIIESEFRYYNFFLANPLIKLLRPDLRVLAQICQIPDVLLSDSKARWVHRLMFFSFLRASDGVAVLSKSLKEQMVQLGAVRDRTHVVYISAQRLTCLEPLHRAEGGDRPPRIVCVAHIRPRKGQKVLIEALHRLDSIPFQAVLIGGTKDQAYEDEIRRLIGEYGMDKQVRLVGLLKGDELCRAYAEADIFVLPSFHEPYGIVVQEAMSFGLPVVASGVDGIAEQVGDGVEGFLVPPGDATALANALHRLLADAQLRESMGRRARKRSTELPTWDDVCELFWKALATLNRDGNAVKDRGK